MRYELRAGGDRIGIEDGIVVDAAGAFDAVVTIGDAHVRPGLINAHDHLHRNHYGRPGHPPYPNAYAWGRDLHLRWRDLIERARSVPRGVALLYGALKNLLGGTTTVAHHDAWEPTFDVGFPVRVVRMRNAHSLGFDLVGVEAAAAARAAGERAPFAMHLAEGIDAAAADEVRSIDALGLLDEHLIAVHGLGADEDGVRRLARSGSAVLWCPTSNQFLFGRTCRRPQLAEVDVLLGTDSLLTGDGTLLDELRAARACGVLSDSRLEDAVGRTAAARLGLPPPAFTAGDAADLVVLRRPLLEASPADVALVIVAGKPALAEAEPWAARLFTAAGIHAETVRFGRLQRLVPASLAAAVRCVAEASSRSITPSATPFKHVR